MRLWVVRFACVLVLGSSSASFGQEPSGPQTLENLLTSDDAEQSAAPAADGTYAGPKRPAGTVARPKDAVQHPDLDKAWADYDAVVAKAAERIKATISKQFDATAAKGDLDAAEKWQTALEKFEKAGELPASTETKAAVGTASSDYKKAKEELVKAYEGVVKALTMEKNIAEAKAVRDELKRLSETTAPNQQDSKPAIVQIFLSDLQERDAVVGYGEFGKNGSLGYNNGDRIKVKGVGYEKGLSMHARDNAASRVIFDVPEGFNRFEAIAAINDGAQNQQKTPLIFKVFGEKRLLWSSRPLLGGGSAEKCSIALKGSKKLMLVVECSGPTGWGQSVWCDPCFTKD